jgi:hypothetical protein
MRQSEMDLDLLTKFARRINVDIRSLGKITLWHMVKGHSPAKSLPAALITLAVGSMLLTPFLSFVSTRSLGTGAAGETFNGQYAADAGIEFGIWSLLNTPSFRSQADINAGVPQALVFPGSLNGFTPTIYVTAIPIGSWYIRQSAPYGINNGGSLAYAGGDRIYLLRGNKKTDFSYYSISGNQWFSLASTLEKVGDGGSLTYGGGNYLYALRGDKNDNFWRYNIVGNSWVSMSDAPDKVEKGGALVYNGGNYIYAFRGKSKGFWRYNISTDSWSSLNNAPDNTGFGSDLVYSGGNYIYAFRGGNKNDFWRYNISGNSWNSLQNTPANVDNGGSLVYYSGNYLYAMRGKTTEFWRYTVTMDSWIAITSAPAAIGKGGDLVFTHSQGGFGLRGGNKTDFWEFEVTPPRYDISSQAGTVTTDTRIELDGTNKEILFWDID